MGMNKAVLGVCCALLLALGGCSRQQSDWEKTRAANTTDAYEQFLKKYPSGEFTAQAQARVKELYEEHDWQKARDADTVDAYQAFIKQYPEGKWTEEARIRVENFTLAQAPPSTNPAGAENAGAADSAGAGRGETAGKPSPPSPSAPPASSPASRAASSAAAPSSAGVPSSSVAPKAPPAAAAKSAAAVAKAASGSGSYGVQFGAFKSGESAHKRWANLEKDYPKLLAGLSPKISPKKTAAGNLHRLQVVDLTEKHARLICRDLKKHAQACVVLPPAHR